MKDGANILPAALLAGLLGWVGENALYGPRYSRVLPGRVPFLPIYAVGGGAVAALAPHLKDLNPLGRFVVYAGTLTAVEGAAGLLERSRGHASWDYEGRPIDLRHTLAWGLLGLAFERVVR